MHRFYFNTQDESERGALVSTAPVMEFGLGCIGTLSAILTRAAKLAETTGSWSPDHLRTALLSELQRKQILEEILDGEAAINPGLTRSMPKLPKTGAQQRKVA